MFILMKVISPVIVLEVNIYLFKLAADFIAPPLTYLFNLSLSRNEIYLLSGDSCLC